MNNINMKSLLENSRELREILMSDHNRPKYHFACPEDDGNPGDPNAAFYAGGRYHLMFLYHCVSDSFRYGHISSADLLHWVRHPDALIPDELDSGGIFSGGAFVDDDGTAYIAYWALKSGEFFKAKNGIRLAYSRDIEGHYSKWTKFENEALAATGCGFKTVVGEDGKELHLAVADPSNIWKKDGVYYLEAGSLIAIQRFGGENGEERYRGDFTDLYRSTDLINWEYVHRFYERDRSNRWTDETEDDMCPSFLPLPRSPEGGEMSDKYLQLFISHNKGCQYYIGNYDEKNDLFYPEKHGRMSWKDNQYFAPEALIAPDGRQIMWVWIKDNRKQEYERFGWSGVYGVPRTLWLNKKGELGIAPIKELKQLRGTEENRIDGLRSACCEIEVSIDISSASKAGVAFYMSEDGEEYSRFYYDTAAKELVYEAYHPGSELMHSLERAPLVLEEGELLRLNIYLDACVAEVFANDRQAIGRKAYLADKNTDRIALYGEGDMKVIEQHFWKIHPTNYI